MLAALAFCVTAIAYLYVSPTIVRKCCRKNRPISAELINEYGDL